MRGLTARGACSCRSFAIARWPPGASQYVATRWEPSKMKIKPSYLKRVQLDIGVAMRQPLNQAGDRLLGPVRVAGDPVANLHDGAPVLRRLILIRGLVCEGRLVSGGRATRVRRRSSRVHTDGRIVRPGRSRSKHRGGLCVSRLGGFLRVCRERSRRFGPSGALVKRNVLGDAGERSQR